MAPPCSASGLRDILGHQVDAGDVEADDAGSQRGQRGGFRMNLIGYVEGMVGVALDQHVAAGGGNVIGGQALAAEFHACGGVDADHRQRV